MPRCARGQARSSDPASRSGRSSRDDRTLSEAAPLTDLPDRLKLAFAFDADALAADARAFDESVWQKHFNTQYYEGDWSGVPLRTPGGRLTILPDPAGTETYADTPLLAQSPAIRDVLAALPCDTTSVRLLRLGPGARVRQHRDYNIGLDAGEIRLHVPVVTGPGVEFVLNERPLRMEPGECWFVDVSCPHRVANPGPSTRVHLVIDCVVNGALMAVLEIAQP